ncbi:hypothetical protein [Pararhodonellum marinum]|uniref:hypothetical protein n=1 Tax=Pararhodonellum marinum TaxID=2755358 RepID=UPI00188E145E|nr:hypothetical protein [Pararhodonellum marinum]
MKTFSLNCLVLMIVLSCGTKPSEKMDSDGKLELEVLDSVRFEYLGQLHLMDVNPEIGKVLFFDQQTRDFLVSDFEGNQLAKFNKTGDAPDSFGSFPLTAGKFIDGSSFRILSYLGAFTYDFEGNLIHAMRYPEPVYFPGRASAESEFFEVENKFHTVGIVPRGEYPNNIPAYYDNFELLAKIDAENGEVERVIKLEEESVFKNGNGHDVSDMIPLIQIRDEKIWMIVGKDLFLNVYDLNPPHALLQKTALPVQEFDQNPGLPMKEMDPLAIRPDMTFGRIKNMKVTDKHVIISYFRGLDELDREEFKALKTFQESQIFLESKKDKYPDHLLVLNKEGEKLTDFEIPSQLHNQQFLFREGFLWFLSRLNLEEEEDFWTVYKVDL